MDAGFVSPAALARGRPASCFFDARPGIWRRRHFTNRFGHRRQLRRPIVDQPGKGGVPVALGFGKHPIGRSKGTEHILGGKHFAIVQISVHTAKQSFKRERPRRIQLFTVPSGQSSRLTSS